MSIDTPSDQSKKIRLLTAFAAYMTSGRALYRQLAQASASNARNLLLDAIALKKRGSRGHSCSLAILAMEESAKALIYSMAAEGVLRIVKKNPNNVTTFREADLLEHPFKHALITGELADLLNYAPFYEVVGSIEEDKMRKEDIEAKLVRAIYAHKRQAMDLRSGGKTAKEVQRMFGLLESLNQKKNGGLYVGHTDGRLLVPNGITKTELNEVLELSETITMFFSQLVRRGIDPTRKMVLMEEMRKNARQIKRILSSTASSCGKD